MLCTKHGKAVRGVERLTTSQQDYLEAILELSPQGEGVRCVDVAARLGVSRASVNKAIGLLRKAGLLDHPRYGSVRLTGEGEATARRIRKIHRTLKRFLVEGLGVDEATADRDACRMEHGISPSTLERLEAYLEKQFGGGA